MALLNPETDSLSEEFFNHRIGKNPYKGGILAGEKEMYRRIFTDCEKSNHNWYMWYDVSMFFDVDYECQIDFLLLCEKGAIVIEVKGGNVVIKNGRYEIQNNAIGDPFAQSTKYRHNLVNNYVFPNYVWVDCICAFPFSTLNITSTNPKVDNGQRLWNKILHDSNDSIADFCWDFLDKHAQRSQMDNVQLRLAAEAFAPTIKNPYRFSHTKMNEILQWLHLNNLDILTGLRQNPRLVIEGGPGTGKTTLAKAFIRQHAKLKGLYVCWNQLLAAKIEHQFGDAQLSNSCDVVTYNSFIAKLSNNSLDMSLIKYKQGTKEKLREVLGQHCKDYDYVIIDEAQDILDCHLDVFIDELAGVNHDGLKNGRFLMLFDTEQGYNHSERNFDVWLSIIEERSAHYILDENKRIDPNLHIVDFAKRLMLIQELDNADLKEEYLNIIKDIENIDSPYLKVKRVEGDKVSKNTKKKIRESIEELKNDGVLGRDIIVLISSDFKEVLYDSIGEMDVLLNHELTASTVCKPSNDDVCYSSILRYKGMEDDNVILVIPQSPIKSSWSNFLFENYVGMTRAIKSLSIILV